MRDDVDPEAIISGLRRMILPPMTEQTHSLAEGINGLFLLLSKATEKPEQELRALVEAYFENDPNLQSVESPLERPRCILTAVADRLSLTLGMADRTDNEIYIIGPSRKDALIFGHQGGTFGKAYDEDFDNFREEGTEEVYVGEDVVIVDGEDEE